MTDARPSLEGQTIVYPPLTEDLKGGLGWRSLRYFGAGAIMAAVTIGTGETLFASRAGALFGYSLLWCFVGGALMKGIQVYVGARHMTLTGQHPMTHWGHMPGPRNWVPATIGFLSLACFPFWLAGIPMIMGQVINWIFGIDSQVLRMSMGELKQTLAQLPAADPFREELLQRHAHLMLLTRVWATATIAVVATLTWLQTYNVFEKAQTLIVGLLLASLLAACAASHPDLLRALAGLLPSIPHYPSWVAVEYPKIAAEPEWVLVGTCLGTIGGGTYDYLGYLSCYREKTWGALSLGRSRITDEDVKPEKVMPIDTCPENVARGKRWLVPVQIDVWIGFLAVLVFASCFILLSAAILHPDHQVPDGFELLSKQARFLTDFHPALVYLYQMGVFMAFWGTTYGAFEIYLRTAYECLAPLSRFVRQTPERRFRAGALAYCTIGGLAVTWFGGDDAIKIVAPAAMVGGVFTCGLWCFAMIWADRRYLPKPLRMGRALTTLTVISGTVLTLLGTKAIWDYATAWFR
jgi:Mn2+/Fe2+ NRAMP family transporter